MPMTPNHPNEPSEDQAPIGSPHVQVVLPDQFGGQKQEIVQVDSNRLSPISEQRLLWLEGMAIPARAEDILLQSASWIAGAGFTASLLRVLPDRVELLAPIGALLVVALAVTLYTWQRLPHLRPFIVYRLGLIGLGFAMAVIL